MATYLFDNSKNLVDEANIDNVYGIDEYKNMVKLKMPVTVPMTLSDGSVLFYDRGVQYGEYIIINGNIIRISEGIDDGSATSTYWRYLICDPSDPVLKKGWGPRGTYEGLIGTAVGIGLPNTEAMISKYRDNDSYWWKFIKEKRDNTGFNWFMPSLDELNLIYNNRDVISLEGLGLSHWSSSEFESDLGHTYDSDFAMFQNFFNGSQLGSYKDSTYYCRVLRRI